MFLDHLYEHYRSTATFESVQDLTSKMPQREVLSPHQEEQLSPILAQMGSSPQAPASDTSSVSSAQDSSPLRSLTNRKRRRSQSESDSDDRRPSPSSFASPQHGSEARDKPQPSHVLTNALDSIRKLQAQRRNTERQLAETKHHNALLQKANIEQSSQLRQALADKQDFKDVWKSAQTKASDRKEKVRIFTEQNAALETSKSSLGEQNVALEISTSSLEEQNDALETSHSHTQRGLASRASTTPRQKALLKPLHWQTARTCCTAEDTNNTVGTNASRPPKEQLDLPSCGTSKDRGMS